MGEAYISTNPNPSHKHRPNAVDIMRDYQYGMNGAIEYRWSSYAPERYVQLYYQITRDFPDPSVVSIRKRKLMTEYQELLINAIHSGNRNDIDHLYRLLLQSRDRKEGKRLNGR